MHRLLQHKLERSAGTLLRSRVHVALCQIRDRSTRVVLSTVWLLKE